MNLFLPLLLLGSGLTALAAKAKSTDLPVINVHVVPHTHDDVGWLKNVDEYYVGSKAGIQQARVQYIIESAIAALEKDPSRKFIYVEMAFFTRWWDQQSEAKKASVRKLVKNGQLEFINAGWCMNDEAATYYQSIIDQMTLGHQFVKKEFDFVPKVGWHIDPFGHSSTQASLFSSMGFDSFMFGRIDHQDKDLRLAEKRMEMIWNPSPSLGTANEIFSAELYHHYSPPEGFCFDVHCGSDPIQARKDLEDYDLDARAALYSVYVRDQASYYRDNNIMQTMGNDFDYEYAEEWFSNLDILINYFKKPEVFEQYKLNVFYSTPSIYALSKFVANVSYEVKTDDFFPYSDGNHAYWTGYFTSRIAFKGYERYSNAYLQVCKQLEVFRDLISGVSVDSSSKLLAVNMGIAQHHDAVSGTAKQAVNDDYTKRLAKGCAECDSVAESAFQPLFSSKEVGEFSRCHYLNLSICDVTENLNDVVSVIVYNSMGQTRTEILRIPVSSAKVAMFDSEGTEVAFQVQELPASTAQARYRVSTPSIATHELVFEPTVAGKSYATYYLKPSAAQKNAVIVIDDEVVLENAYLKAEFSSDGTLASLTNKVSNKAINIAQTWEYYVSSTGTPDDGQASGAYIFRPVDSNTISLGSKAAISVVRGAVSDEVRQVFSNRVTQITRLAHSKPYLEVEYTLGPIDVSDGIGKEVIFKLQTDLSTNDTFYTDANGREILKRVINYRETWPLTVTEPVSDNYYPVNSRIILQDEASNAQLAIITDRSHGGASLTSGEVEIMVNRRTLKDDDRGVGEPLNEDIVTRGKFWIVLDDIESATESHRLLAERMQNPVSPFFTTESPSTPVSTLFGSKDLPENIHLVTLQKFDEQSDLILLRLGHLFATGESARYSVPTKVDLEATLGVTLIEEMSMTANQRLSEMRRLPFNGVSKHVSSSVVKGSIVSIAPMEIRTYLVKLTH